MGSKCTINVGERSWGSKGFGEGCKALVVDHTAHFVADYMQEKAHIWRVTVTTFLSRQYTSLHEFPV